MWMRWFPWRMLVKRLAKDTGFLDPFDLVAQFQRFAQPSEVAFPIEIIRLAAGLHARGLMNSQAIQHNLDWVWPFWVERQFNPHDPAFIPRAFSISHINLTHRNWTAVGIPDCSLYPIVDPAGLVTPFLDSWSIDSWLLVEGRVGLIPSRHPAVSQSLLTEGNLAVLTEAKIDSASWSSKVEVNGEPSSPVCRIEVKASSDLKAWCVITPRPYNPEGVSFIHEIDLLEETRGWKVNKKNYIYLNQTPDRSGFSDYRSGDVRHLIPHAKHGEKIICDVGMATAAAIYDLEPGATREIVVEIPLSGHGGERYKTGESIPSGRERWMESLQGSCELRIPDPQFQCLYEAALRSLVLHAPGDLYPGPYTYKHFWFRDAAFMVHALLCSGLFERAEKVIQCNFFSRQTPFGYFHSQDGEWDSNGEALWTLMRFCQLTGKPPHPEWKKPIKKAARWIERKRLPEDSEAPHAGLFPPGFSAEHLGPNDFYYWDDFWGVSGLRAASYFAGLYQDREQAVLYENQSESFLKCIDRSLRAVEKRLGQRAVPASPHRRMDTGAIGSLAASYPLQLWEASDPRLRETIEYLIQDCCVEGGFFHDMSHSGINPYLTLHIAQALLRAGDARYYQVMKAVADLASPTGQWPEAVHPKTKGGCMGDGHHVWASAEWILMMRNCFVREEKDRLVLFSGIPASWIESGEEIRFGAAPTTFGPVQLRIKRDGENVKLMWDGRWFAARPLIEIHPPGHEKIVAGENQDELQMSAAARP